MEKPQHHSRQQRNKVKAHATPHEIESHCGTGDAAKLLGMSVGTIHKLVSKNELEAWKTRGGHRKISMASIEKYRHRLGTILHQSPHKDARLRVLLVEDDAVTRQMVQGYCNNATLPVHCTAMASGMEAMIRITDIQPDLLITDLDMPGIDGFELLRLLSQNPRFDHIALMVLTALTPEEIQARGELPQGIIFLSKPAKALWFTGFFTGILLGLTKKNNEQRLN